MCIDVCIDVCVGMSDDNRWQSQKNDILTAALGLPIVIVTDNDPLQSVESYYTTYTSPILLPRSCIISLALFFIRFALVFAFENTLFCGMYIDMCFDMWVSMGVGGGWRSTVTLTVTFDIKITNAVVLAIIVPLILTVTIIGIFIVALEKSRTCDSHGQIIQFHCNLRSHL